MKRIEYKKEEIPERGDIVRIRTIKEVIDKYENVFTLDSEGFPQHYRKASIGRPSSGFDRVIARRVDGVGFPHIYYRYDRDFERKVANRLARVTSVVRGGATLNLTAIPVAGNKTTEAFSVATEMVEVVEKYDEDTRIKKMQKKKVERMEKTNYENITEEMISKVDKTKFKRIISASFGINARDVKGVDVILQEWAEAKKDIYLLFDRKLTVTQESEFALDDNERNVIMKEIKQKFPAHYYFINDYFSFNGEVFPNEVSNHGEGIDYLRQYLPNIKGRNEILTINASSISRCKIR